MQHLTISSDGNGSLPKFDEAGKMIGFGVASTQTLYQQVIAAVKNQALFIEEILPLVTSNTAEALKLNNKGGIQEGKDADVLILDKETLALEHVFAKGRHMLENKKLLVKGTFEK